MLKIKFNWIHLPTKLFQQNSISNLGTILNGGSLTGGLSVQEITLFLLFVFGLNESTLYFRPKQSYADPQTLRPLLLHPIPSNNNLSTFQGFPANNFLCAHRKKFSVFFLLCFPFVIQLNAN